MEEIPKFQRRRRRRSAKQVEPDRRKREIETMSARLSRIATMFIGVVVVMILISGAFLLGRQFGIGAGQGTAVKVDGVRSSPRAISSVRREAIGKVDEALTLKAAGDLEAALKALDAAIKIEPGLPGASYEKAAILGRQDKVLEATRFLEVSMDRGERIVEGQILRAQWVSAQRASTGLHADEDAFQSAVAAEPFNALPFHKWGERLREKGKHLEATVRLRQASLRASDPAESFIIGLKLALARVEANDSRFLTEELPVALQQPDPPADALLAAAADAISRNELEEGAEYLRRLQERMPPELFAVILEDRAISFYQDRPAFRDFYIGAQE